MEGKVDRYGNTPNGSRSQEEKRNKNGFINSTVQKNRLSGLWGRVAGRTILVRNSALASTPGVGTQAEYRRNLDVITCMSNVHLQN